MARLILLSLLWTFLGLILALAVPWIGLTPSLVQAVVNTGALLLTVTLIICNLVESVRLVGRTGRTLAALPLTLVQLMLFALLFFQIACHRGAEHYTWTELPRWWDWLGFIAAHTLRAADVFDITDAYGWKIQTIEHASHLTSISLIAFELLIGLFLISVLLEGINRVKKAALENEARLALVFRVVLWCSVGVFVAVWLMSALLIRPWRVMDLFWWPIDNLLRVVDFMDAMEIYGIRLHAVPKVWWEGTLTAFCRILLAVILGGALSWVSREISIRWWGGWGLNEADLEDICQHHPHRSARQMAKDRLDEITGTDVPDFATGWSPRNVAFGVGLALSLILLLLFTWPREDSVVIHLAEAAAQPEQGKSDLALAALRRMGPYAASAVPVLSQSLPRLPRERQLPCLAVLGFLGPQAIETLSNWVRVTDGEMVLVGVRALQQIGPSAVPVLASVLDSPHEPVRQAAENALLVIGGKAIQPLLDTLTLENASTRMGRL